jgi:hypothetical protein
VEKYWEQIPVLSGKSLGGKLDFCKGIKKEGISKIYE